MVHLSPSLLLHFPDHPNSLKDLPSDLSASFIPLSLGTHSFCLVLSLALSGCCQVPPLPRNDDGKPKRQRLDGLGPWGRGRRRAEKEGRSTQLQCKEWVDEGGGQAVGRML